MKVYFIHWETGCLWSQVPFPPHLPVFQQRALFNQALDNGRKEVKCHKHFMWVSKQKSKEILQFLTLYLPPRLNELIFKCSSFDKVHRHYDWISISSQWLRRTFINIKRRTWQDKAPCYTQFPLLYISEFRMLKTPPKYFPIYSQIVCFQGLDTSLPPYCSWSTKQHISQELTSIWKKTQHSSFRTHPAPAEYR